ncbi:MAG: DUF2970 domain-containing protein [Betaproteobacteria bacterium]|nr:DUF2970 domain-containing protein [Betaproteobacteria bacterium]
MRDAFKAVLWSFFGVRKRAEYEADQRRLKPAQIIGAGVVCALVFVIALYLLVRAVVTM